MAVWEGGGSAGVTDYGGTRRPQGSFELASWLFMRVSGVLLWILVLGHMFVMHIQHDVTEVDYAFVAARWATPFWRIYDWTMLILALIHGMNGLRIIVYDYVRARGWRLVAVATLYVAALVFLLIGSVAIITF
ncbi:MAG TPA: succinate dehydrogenase hydrophobic membrane anchor subunit [Limnochordia bacterium]